jgi:threonine dehydrogenase-like Zn-dependent dehydrogenase
MPAIQSTRSAETMRGAILHAPGNFVIRTDIPVPVPAASQVRVRLEGCGVCGSNLSPFEGRPWFTYPRNPGEPGHEGWGEIEAIGSDAGDFRIGERVAMLSYNAFAEYDVAEASAIVRLPPLLEKKPFPGEALGCAMNVFRRCEIEPGHTVAIVGIGFMGALLTALASSAGATVIAITRRQFALGIAAQMGARHRIPMEDHQKIIEQVKDLTRGVGCDRVIEAVGAQWPLDLAAELTRERGKLIVAGYHQDGPRQVNMQLWNWRGLDVINAHERDPCVYRQGMEEAVEAVASGSLKPWPLFTHSFPLERINDAFETMAKRPGGFMKAIIKL